MERIWLKSYPKGAPAEIDASGFGSLGDFLAESVGKFRARTAFISMGKAISYDELELKSRAFASYLTNVARLPQGARVALMMPNLLQYPIAAFGALRAGYVVVNCNPLYSPRELNHQLADSGAETIVVLENFAGTLEKAIGGTAVRAVIVTGVGDQLGGVRGLLVNAVVRHVRRAVPAFRLPQAVRFNRALALGARRPFADPPVKPDDIAFLQYTGGTTGVPKGAMLTHRNMIANLRQIHAWVAPAIQSDGEMFVAALPLYHVFALQVNGFVPLMIGASYLMIANPRDIPALVKALRQAPFTVLIGVNTLFNALINNKDFAKLDFSRLHLAIGGGMAVQRTVAERWQATTGKPLIEAYGLTETSPAAIANPLTIDHFTGAIGLPMPSTDIAIRDDDGRDLKVGETGELCIKGPQVMAGYWNRPDETAKVMTADGFLRTGDIAEVDERGYVHIVDRKKDMINVSGFNVYPNEIEDVAMGHPGVLEVGAVGVADAKTGEAVKLVVVRKDRA
jgi:long-chain acyl-CoA synthetase